GRKLGMAFQITDDALDYDAGNTALGKNIGDDLAEGKTTLPLITAIHRAPAAQADTIARAIDAGDHTQLSAINKIIESTQAMQYTCRHAQDEASAAVASLDALSDSNCKSALAQLADFSVQRSF